jgi:hypothetical protein
MYLDLLLCTDVFHFNFWWFINCVFMVRTIIVVIVVCCFSHYSLPQHFRFYLDVRVPLTGSPGPKIIKLSLETRLNSQASEAWDSSLVSIFSFVILGPVWSSYKSNIYPSHRADNLHFIKSLGLIIRHTFAG